MYFFDNTFILEDIFQEDAILDIFTVIVFSFLCILKSG